MNRLLIADDEVVERNALRLMVSKDLRDFEVVGEAENGIETIERTRQLRPDLVLLDIKMPGIDGLSAIHEIRKFDQHVRFVVLSAHNDFEYAQTALKLGADDYLLKPARIHKLAETLQNVAQKVSIERLHALQTRNMQSKIDSLRPDLESRIVAWATSGVSDDESIEQYIRFLDIQLFPCVSLVIRFHRPFSCAQEKHSFLREFEEKLRAVCPQFLCEFMYDTLVAFLPVGQTLDSDGLLHWVEELNRYVKAVLQGLRVFHSGLGISVAADHYTQLHNAYQQALKEARRSVPSQEKELFTAHDLYQKELKLIEKIMLGDLNQSLALFSELFDNYCTQNENDISALKTKLRDLIVVVKRKLIHEKNQTGSLDSIIETQLVQLARVVTPGDLLALSKTIVSQCVAFCESNSCAGADILDNAVDYVVKNFTKSFSLETIAHELGVSAPYLSRLFKLRLGKNFIDYMTELRIEHAKRLIKDGKMSIKEITYAVGYNSQTYFCKVFKKVVGVPASHYANAADSNREIG